MNKKHLALICLAAFSAAAYAQSNFTMYGTADTAVAIVNNQGGGRVLSLGSGRGTSFFGFKGMEDLGGGMKATFWLESGFGLKNGALAGALFQRQATVGLLGDWGHLTLGNHFDPVAETLIWHSAAQNYAGSFGAHAADVDNVWGDSYIANSIKYKSPSFNGLTFSGLVGLGEAVGNTSTNRVTGISASYANGPLSLGAVYRVANNPIVSLWRGTSAPVSSQTIGVPWNSPIYSGYLSADSISTAGIGGSYKIGKGTVRGIITRTTFKDILPSAATGPALSDARFNNYAVNYSYDVSPALTLSGGATYTSAESATYRQFHLATDYAFSKRTDWYVIFTKMTANGTDSTGRQAVASIANIPASTTSQQTGVRIGLRHKF